MNRKEIEEKLIRVLKDWAQHECHMPELNDKDITRMVRGLLAEFIIKRESYIENQLNERICTTENLLDEIKRFKEREKKLMEALIFYASLRVIPSVRPKTIPDKAIETLKSINYSEGDDR